jgi:hypothetical protein
VGCQPQKKGILKVTLDDDSRQLPQSAAVEKKGWVAKADKRFGEQGSNMLEEVDL